MMRHGAPQVAPFEQASGRAPPFPGIIPHQAEPGSPVGRGRPGRSPEGLQPAPDADRHPLVNRTTVPHFVTSSSAPVSSPNVPADIDQRRRRVRRFIDTNFGSQRAFCEATGLKPARVSKALQDRYVSNRRLLPLEHAIEQWRAERGRSAVESDHTVPVYRLVGGEPHPIGDREPVGPRLIGSRIDRERLLYVEVTFGHHAIIEQGRSDRLHLDDLHGSQPPGTTEYAGLVDDVWAYVPVRFGRDGQASLPDSLDERRVVLFGRVVTTLQPRQDR